MTGTEFQEETEVRSAVQRGALKWRRYGYRKVQAALRIEGYVVNHKRVLRLLREDNLLRQSGVAGRTRLLSHMGMI